MKMLLKIGAVVGATAMLAGATQLGDAGAHHAPSYPSIWVGAPTSGQWPWEDADRGCALGISRLCSLPYLHHRPYGGDFAVDLRNVMESSTTGKPLYLYAAPDNPAYGGRVSARVASVRPACASGVIADGGHVVRVDLFFDSTRVGQVVYAHIVPSVVAGQTISRWHGYLGRAGVYRRNGCWGGSHVHFEMYSTRHYACFNRGWQPGQWFSPTNFVGFVGGAYAFGVGRACP